MPESKKKREPRYIEVINTVVPNDGEPFLRIGTNLKKIRKMQRQEWKRGNNA